jgi:hypothetical protein
MAGDAIPWGAKVHVRPLPGRSNELEGDVAGAYAFILALARDETSYRELVASEMEEIGLYVVDLDYVAPFVPRPGDSETVRQCAQRLSQEWPIQYHSFHTYPHDDA